MTTTDITATGPTSTLVSFATPAGERTTDARCWMVVIDESASMSTADEFGTRADAVRAASEFLAAYGLDGERIGVTWFAGRRLPKAPVNQPRGSVRIAGPFEGDVEPARPPSDASTRPTRFGRGGRGR